MSCGAKSNRLLLGLGRLRTHVCHRGKLPLASQLAIAPDGFRRILIWEVAKMLVADVLRTKGHDVIKVRADDTIEAAVRKLAEHRIGALVVENQWMKRVGIFSERDLVNGIARDGSAVLGFQVQKLMSYAIVTCRSSDRVDAALAAMTLAKIRHLPVIDGDNLRGIISIGDLVKHRLDEKELEANVLLELSRMRA